MYRSVFKQQIAKMVHESRHRQTGIVCTIGLNNSSEFITNLVENGMSIMRVNCSHGDHSHHQKSVDNLRAYMHKRNSHRGHKQVGTLIDIRGPKIRTGLLQEKEYEYNVGNKFRIKLVPTAEIPNHRGNRDVIYCDYLSFPKTVKVGGRILIDDGLMEVQCTALGDDWVEVEVKNRAILCERKGVLIPGESIDLPAVSDKDKADLLFAARNGVDFVAASFIRKAEQVREVRDFLKGNNGHNIKIISKVENQEGLDNIDGIIQESDGVMVARGDLGVELPPEKIFSAQKMIIRKCNLSAKPVITATQMLESMTFYPVPTRAECTDVANAILDGTDCVMLSGETAKGKYPDLAVKTMNKICHGAEEAIDYETDFVRLFEETDKPVSANEMMAYSAVKIAYEMQAKLILVMTETGLTARYISKYRPPIPIICLTYDSSVARQVSINKGVISWLLQEEDKKKNLEQIFNDCYKESIQLGYINASDRDHALGVGLYDRDIYDNREEVTNMKLFYYKP